MRFAEMLLDFLWRQTCRFGIHRMFWLTVHWDMSHTRVTWQVPCCKHCHAIEQDNMQQIASHSAFMRVRPYSNPFPM